MEIIFSIMKNEVKKINVPETENLASALIGCYDSFCYDTRADNLNQLQFSISIFRQNMSQITNNDEFDLEVKFTI
jgi:hypothetical protein